MTVRPQVAAKECIATAHAGLQVLGGRMASPAVGQPEPSDPQQILPANAEHTVNNLEKN